MNGRSTVTWGFEDGTPKGFADDVRNLFRRPMVEIVKRSKRGEETVNMRELMRDLTVTDGPDEVTAVVTTAAGNNNMSPEYLAVPSGSICRSTRFRSARTTA